MLIDGSGHTVLTERLTIAAGARSLRFALGSRRTLAPGDYQVQIRAKGTAAPLGATARDDLGERLAVDPLAGDERCAARIGADAIGRDDAAVSEACRGAHFLAQRIGCARRP